MCWTMAITETGKSGGQMCTGRNADTLRRSLMFTLVISNLPGICLSVHISPLKRLHITDFKIALIYAVLTYLHTLCMNEREGGRYKSYTSTI